MADRCWQVGRQRDLAAQGSFRPLEHLVLYQSNATQLFALISIECLE
jgi:hypothetical protein